MMTEWVAVGMRMNYGRLCMLECAVTNKHGMESVINLQWHESVGIEEEIVRDVLSFQESRRVYNCKQDCQVGG